MDLSPGKHVEIVGDVRKIPRPDETYDEVYSHWVLEHFHREELPNVLKEWKRVLKPGGKIVAVTSNGEAINQSLANGEITWDEWCYLTFANPDDAGLHKIAFSEKYLVSFFIRSGLVPEITSIQWGCYANGVLSCPAITVEATK